MQGYDQAGKGWGRRAFQKDAYSRLGMWLTRSSYLLDRGSHTPAPHHPSRYTLQCFSHIGHCVALHHTIKSSATN